MKKGISSVVAVVLLIAISVIAAVSIYFWIGGMVSQRGVGKEPMTIEATPVNPSEGEVLVANKGGTPITLSELETGEENVSCDFGETVTLQPNGQAVCTLPPKRGKTSLFAKDVAPTTITTTEEDIPEDITLQSNPGFSKATWKLTNFNQPNATFTNTQEGSVTLKGNTPTFDGEWVTFQHDKRNTGKTTEKGADSNQTLWTFDTGSAVISSPAVKNKTVYFGSGNGYVYAVDVNGTQLWNTSVDESSGDGLFPPPYYPIADPVYSSPTVYNENVYILSQYTSDGATNGKLWKLDASTGAAEKLRSVTAPEGYNFLSSPTVSDDMIYVTGGKYLLAFDSTGRYQWNVTTKDVVHGSPAVYNGKVFFGSDDSKVYKVDAASGEVLANTSFGSGNHSAILVHDGRIFFQADGYCSGGGSPITAQVSGDLSPCSKLYAVDIGKMGTAGQEDSIVIGSSSSLSSPAVGLDGTIYVGSDEGLKAVEPHSSGFKWSYGDEDIGSSPAVGSDGTIYVGSQDTNDTYALNPDGTLKWKYKTGDQVFSSPAVAGGITFVGSFDGKVYAFGGYKLSGNYVSPVKDSGQDSTSWTSFSWENKSVNPPNQNLTLSVDVANDTSNLNPALEGVSKGDDPGVGRYLQFKAELSTDNKTESPVLEETTVDYKPQYTNLTVSVNDEDGISEVGLWKDCGSGYEEVFNETSLSGTFFTRKETGLLTNCAYKVYGTDSKGTDIGPKTINA